jgi:ribosome-binding factor A
MGDVCRKEEAERFFFDLESARPDHRVRSLCRQAQEAVWMAMAEMELDARLEGAWVASVDPAPGPERLLVTVVLPASAAMAEVEEAFVALMEAKGELRAAVARGIHRKRVPDLAFRVVLEGPHEG